MEVSVYRSQENILKEFDRVRSPVIPIFEAIYTAVPNGMELSSIRISETGSLHVQCSGKNPQIGSQFIKDLEESGLFVKGSVEMTDQKTGSKGKITFQISAMIKGRGKR